MKFCMAFLMAISMWGCQGEFDEVNPVGCWRFSNGMEILLLRLEDEGIANYSVQNAHGIFEYTSTWSLIADNHSVSILIGGFCVNERHLKTGCIGSQEVVPYYVNGFFGEKLVFRPDEGFVLTRHVCD